MKPTRGTVPIGNDMTQPVNLIDATTLEILRKFNSGKNAKGLSNDLDPGTYARTITVTISGSLTKAEPYTEQRRSNAGSANLLRWALDRMTDAEFAVLADNLVDIRKGKFDHKNEDRYTSRIDAIAPLVESTKAGAVTFTDALVLVTSEVEGRLDTEEGRGTGLTIRASD